MPRTVGTGDFPGFSAAAAALAFEAAVAAASEWLETARVELVGVETVVLPNIDVVGESGSSDTALPTYQQSTWHQVVRVWYRE